MTHLVCLNGKGDKRTKQAIIKMRNELESTQKWENDWKIRSNPDKCSIQYFCTSQEIINKFGGIRINNEELRSTTEIKMLGATIAKQKNCYTYTKAILTKAKTNLSRLKRFQSAPPKVKPTLYKTLIRPILEYPYITL